MGGGTVGRWDDLKRARFSPGQWNYNHSGVGEDRIGGREVKGLMMRNHHGRRAQLWLQSSGGPKIHPKYQVRLKCVKTEDPGAVSQGCKDWDGDAAGMLSIGRGHGNCMRLCRSQCVRSLGSIGKKQEARSKKQEARSKKRAESVGWAECKTACRTAA